ncbi:MAG TPA: hypothetical protein DCL98_02705 [Flavobacteriales bacterium]|nr:hypothetical protein [Flavobacteriales bacterium]
MNRARRRANPRRPGQCPYPTFARRGRAATQSAHGSPRRRLPRLGLLPRRRLRRPRRHVPPCAPFAGPSNTRSPPHSTRAPRL